MSNRKQRTYHFNTDWEQQFCFTDVKGNSVCLLLKVGVVVRKKSNIERTYVFYGDFNKTFPIDSGIKRRILILSQDQPSSMFVPDEISIIKI
jgi:hypothetical protein